MLRFFCTGEGSKKEGISRCDARSFFIPLLPRWEKGLGDEGEKLASRVLALKLTRMTDVRPV